MGFDLTLQVLASVVDLGGRQAGEVKHSRLPWGKCWVSAYLDGLMESNDGFGSRECRL